MTMKLHLSLATDLSWQQQANWQVPTSPFMSLSFWQTLMSTEAIGEASGWWPIFVLIHQTAADSQSSLVAVMPFFIKNHHRGEFVFDYLWADAFLQAGADYYPRLVTAVPFTPVTGERLWLSENVTLSPAIVKMAMAGVDIIASQVGASSWHGLFVTAQFCQLAAQALAADDQKPKIANENLKAAPLLERQGCRFLWQNQHLANGSQKFDGFTDFLSTLTAKRRKTIKAERRKVAAQGITCQRKVGAEINDEDWHAFYHCYVMTYAVRGQSPYFSFEFFAALLQDMPDQLMLAQALDSNGEIIASSLFFFDLPHDDQRQTSLYGRYWGTLGEFDSLHFELCYYQGIEFAIEQQLDYFDPGTQGEHKLIRGFVPSLTHSVHRIFDPRFVKAIEGFCAEDRKRMRQYRQEAFAALPFNQDNLPPKPDDFIEP